MTSRAITAQELSTRTSIPAILVARHDVPNIAVGSLCWSSPAQRRPSLLAPGVNAAPFSRLLAEVALPLLLNELAADPAR